MFTLLFGHATGIVGQIVDATGAFHACWITLAVVNIIGVLFWVLMREEKTETKAPHPATSSQN